MSLFRKTTQEAEPTQSKTTGEASGNDTLPSDDGAHLDGFTMPNFDADQIDEDAPIDLGDDLGGAGDPTHELISQDDFWQVFQTAFSLPGAFVPDFAPLAIQPRETSRARIASDGVYGLLKIYYPGALMPQGETLAHLMACTPFFIAKAMVVREIIRAKADAAARADDRDQANSAPEEGQRTYAPADDFLPVTINQAGPSKESGEGEE